MTGSARQRDAAAAIQPLRPRRSDVARQHQFVPQVDQLVDHHIEADVVVGPLHQHLLIDQPQNYQHLVRNEDLSRTYLDAGGGTSPASFRTLIRRVAKRLSEVGLKLHVVRRRGVILAKDEAQPVPLGEPVPPPRHES